MAFLDTHRHNAGVEVAGVTFAPTFEIINGYTVAFEETGSHYSIRLTGSNNNLFEDGIFVPGMFGIIAQNSAGLITVATGGGPTASQVADAVWDEDLTAHASASSAGAELAAAAALLDQMDGVESGTTLRQALRLILAANAGKLSGATGTTITIRDINDLKDRIIATVDGSGNRTAVTTDPS